MYRAGLVLAGLVGGMVVFGGSALAATSGAPGGYGPGGYGPGYGPHYAGGYEWDTGEFNNFGDDRDLLDLDLLSNLLGGALSNR
ncbi:hypothetical protein [Nonomuraea wenchangensis]|uniref:Uncharacterized protein n=1 Tax=Nonomuraea wenchangensis TaxID=568860 RepID=A0A1I0D7Q4_9ACTN|nr:hypothetical protein [Nonomuraea wenchangensis]SET28260.1 hypothetical protein SAMN05421811_102615 [Nonomuraea wenchangensis]